MSERPAPRLRSALAALARAVAERLERVATAIADDPGRELRGGGPPGADQAAVEAGPAAWWDYVRRHGTGAWEEFEHPALRQPPQAAAASDQGPAPAGRPNEPFAGGHEVAGQAPGEAGSSAVATAARELGLAARQPDEGDLLPDPLGSQRTRASIGPPPERLLRPVRLSPATKRDEGLWVQSGGAEPTDRTERAAGAWDLTPHDGYGPAPSSDNVGGPLEHTHQRLSSVAMAHTTWLSTGPATAPVSGHAGAGTSAGTWADTRADTGPDTGADATTLASGLGGRHADGALSAARDADSARPATRHAGAHLPLAGLIPMASLAADSHDGFSRRPAPPITWPPAPEPEPEPELTATLQVEGLRLLEERRHRERLAREQRGVPWSE